MPAANASRLLPALGALLVLLQVGGCATNPVTGHSDLVFMSEQQELALGAQAHNEILKQYAAYDDPALQRYVDAIGQSLAAHSHRARIAFRFTVLDSSEVNAFALPGGYVYITRGLVSFLNSEAELAAVLGHEVGHVTARHAVRQQSTAQAAGIGTSLLGIFVPQISSAGLSQTINLLGTALLRGYGREMELEADRLGAEYLSRTGYDPQAMIAVIGVLKDQEAFDRLLAAAEGRAPRAYHGLFSTHPSNDQRLREAVAHGAQLDAAGGELRRDPFLDRIDGLVVGDNPEGGVVHGRQYHHAALNFAIDLPEGWVARNLPDRLLLSAPQGAVQIQLTASRLEPGQALADFVHRPESQPLTGMERLAINGLQGITGITQVTAAGQPLPARALVVAHDGRAFLLMGAAHSAANFRQFDPVVLAVARSFRPLTAAERTGTRANRLRVVARQNAVTWAELAAKSPLPQFAESQLRLLNGSPSSSTGPQTARYKVVE